MTLIHRTALAITILAAAGITPSVLAQQYPAKPIRMLIPSPPGGGTDVLGRLLQEGMNKMWGQPVIVDNRGGASGRIAAEIAAKAVPDGYTLLFTYGGVLVTGLPLFRNLPYHPIKDFAPVAMMAHVPGVLLAHPSFPAKSVAELIALAKSKPGQLTHGTSSIGSSSHLNMELFKQMAGIDMLRVSYNGDAPALIALLGGHVLFAFNNVVAAAPHIKSGRLKVLAVATAQRVPGLPEAPAIAESGLPGYDVLLFYTLVAPAKTPRTVVNKLNQAVSQIKQNPDVKLQLSRLGAIPMEMTPEESAAFIKSELEKWTKVINTGRIESN
ncbi:MAG: tripartite tricarboxylate transporter substrate binding protein [Betaproteobacteria bacterium]|nr:tripartite tricarboxylate transporter substrate binding protein [Betaproteobacteria bacterium]